MRTVAIILVSMLVPFAMWTAGCRNNSQQAKFPSGPEVKNLARAPGNNRSRSAAKRRTSVQKAPEIDPDVLSAPDQPTFSRIRAVMDREAQLAARRDEDGMFNLPRIDSKEFASTPVGDSKTGEYQALTGPDFWSKPAPASHPVNIPSIRHDNTLSAMMPPAGKEIINEKSPAMMPGVYMGMDIASTEAVAPIAMPSIADLPPLLSLDAFESISTESLNHELVTFTSNDRIANDVLAIPAKAEMEKTNDTFDTLPSVRERNGEEISRIAALLRRETAKQALEPLPVLADALDSVEEPMPMPPPSDMYSNRRPAEIDAQVAPPMDRPAPGFMPEAPQETFTKSREFWNDPMPLTIGERLGLAEIEEVDDMAKFELSLFKPSTPQEPQKVVMKPADQAKAIDSNIEAPPLVD